MAHDRTWTKLMSTSDAAAVISNFFEMCSKHASHLASNFHAQIAILNPLTILSNTLFLHQYCKLTRQWAVIANFVLLRRERNCKCGKMIKSFSLSLTHLWSAGSLSLLHV